MKILFRGVAIVMFIPTLTGITQYSLKKYLYSYASLKRSNNITR